MTPIEPVNLPDLTVGEVHAKIRLFGTWDVQSLGAEVHGLPQLSAILELDVLGEHGGRVVFVFDPPCRVVHPQHLFA